LKTDRIQFTGANNTHVDAIEDSDSVQFYFTLSLNYNNPTDENISFRLHQRIMYFSFFFADGRGISTNGQEAGGSGTSVLAAQSNGSIITSIKITFSRDYAHDMEPYLTNLEFTLFPLHPLVNVPYFSDLYFSGYMSHGLPFENIFQQYRLYWANSSAAT